MALRLAAWEEPLRRGRLEERKGLFKKAEASFRAAASVAGEAASPWVELARFLESSGRLAEAEASLRRAETIEKGSSEIQLALGRLLERRGESGEAEERFRRASSLDPVSPLPRLDLARILERSGRLEESQAAARAACALIPAAWAGGDGFFSVLERKPCREAFLKDAAGSPGGLVRLEQSLRGSRELRARTLLVDVLLEQGRLDEAEREAQRALRDRRASPDPLRLDCHVELVERGRFGAVASLLAFLEAGGQGACADWSSLFSALICAGRYVEAFRAAEAALKRFPGALGPQCFQWPWWRKVPRAVAEASFCEAEVARLSAAEEDPRFGRWFAYCRAVLQNGRGRMQDVLVEYPRIAGVRETRLIWMHQPFLLAKLSLCDLEGAAAVARLILRRAPGQWWVRCRLAEALLAGGRQDLGLREFQKAERAADAVSRREVLTWHGEALLWLGRYREALGKLDAAISLGAKTFAHGWRGAAWLKLGEVSRALADLDLAVEHDPKDFEALVWRGEALRRLGRFEEAVRDLDRAAESPAGVCDWARLNRALVRGAQGDAAGLAADFEALDPAIKSFLRRRGGLPAEGPVTAAETARILELGLKLARGIRRQESYLRPLWMGKA